jgi:hypothetical protein
MGGRMVGGWVGRGGKVWSQRVDREREREEREEEQDTKVLQGEILNEINI